MIEFNLSKGVFVWPLLMILSCTIMNSVGKVEGASVSVEELGPSTGISTSSINQDCDPYLFALHLVDGDLGEDYNITYTISSGSTSFGTGAVSLIGRGSEGASFAVLSFPQHPDRDSSQCPSFSSYTVIVSGFSDTATTTGTLSVAASAVDDESLFPGCYSEDAGTPTSHICGFTSSLRVLDNQDDTRWPMDPVSGTYSVAACKGETESGGSTPSVVNGNDGARCQCAGGVFDIPWTSDASEEDLESCSGVWTHPAMPDDDGSLVGFLDEYALVIFVTGVSTVVMGVAILCLAKGSNRDKVRSTPPRKLSKEDKPSSDRSGAPIARPIGEIMRERAASGQTGGKKVRTQTGIGFSGGDWEYTVIDVEKPNGGSGSSGGGGGLNGSGRKASKGRKRSASRNSKGSRGSKNSKGSRGGKRRPSATRNGSKRRPSSSSGRKGSSSSGRKGSSSRAEPPGPSFKGYEAATIDLGGEARPVAEYMASSDFRSAQAKSELNSMQAPNFGGSFKVDSMSDLKTDNTKQ